MTSPKKRVTVTTRTTTEMTMRSSFANQFLDQREHAVIAIDLQKAELAVETLSQTLTSVS
jgi:hypothetical protein